MKYDSKWLNILQMNAVHSQMYAQWLSVYRSAWEAERINLLESIPRRKGKTLK